MALFKKTRAVAAVAAAFALAIGATALALPTRGRLTLTLPSGGAESEATDSYFRVWNGFVAPQVASVDVPREITAVLLGSGGESLGCSYGYTGGALMPSTMVARAGATIDFMNTDGCNHEPVAEGVEGLSGTPVAPGNRIQFPAPGVGTYAVTDQLYGHVQGTLHVVPDLVACGRVAPNGVIDFGDVPTGSYTLKVFRGEEVLAERRVNVAGAREATLEAVPVRITRP